MKNTIQSESAGFTLVEIAIVIVIIGLIFAVSIGVFKQYDQAIRLEQSERLIENSRVAIQNFRLATGRYPCPASPAIAPNAPNYGVEDCTLVRTDTIRNVQFMQGMFPFNTPIPSTGGTTPLGQTINSEEIIKTDFLDNWGRPLQYAVTADLAAPPGGVFNPANGALRVVDELGRDTGGTNSDAHYVVFSNGENPCPTIDLSGGSIDLAAANVGSSVSNLESENCIQNTLVTDPMCAADPTLPGCTITGERLGVDATYMAALQGERYDDLISFEHYRNTQAWNSLVDSAGNSTNHITTLDPTSRVGLGTTAPTQTLDVIGNIRADGNVSARRLCNENGVCFNPESILNVECPAGSSEYISAINIDASGNLTPVCTDLAFEIPGSCPGGRTIQGIFTTIGGGIVNPIICN